MRTCQAIPLSLLLVVGVLAQNGPSRPKPTPVVHTTAQARLSDAQIEAAIRAKLAKSKKISLDKFQVHVQGGVATLEGKTEVVQHKGSATRMAKSAGALAVNNKIQVSEAARQKSAGSLEQGRRRAQIKREEPRSSVR